MCGRFASQLPPELIARLFRTDGPLPNLPPNWNVAPSQPALTVRRDPDSGERRVDVLSWGFVPFNTKSLKKAQRPFNARAETVATSSVFRGAWQRRRCLVPCDAFYEWKAVTDGKQPYAVARVDGAPLALAGVWESWRDDAGEIMRTFAIITTRANTDMAPLHDRMPVIVEEEDWRTWLGEVPRDPLELLRPAEAGTVRFWAVGRAVNSAANNGSGLLDPVSA